VPRADQGLTALQLAGEHLLEGIDLLVEQITERVWRAVTGYDDTLPERALLAAQVRPNILNTLEFLRSGRDLSDDDRTRLDDLGRSRALQGVPAAAMVQSFRTAERALIDAFCIFCIQHGINAAEQRSGIRAITSVLDKTEALTFDAYLATQRLLQYEHDNSTAVLIARMVEGSVNDRVEVDAQARLVGANPEFGYRCLAFAPMPAETEEAGPDPEALIDPTPRLTRLRRHLVSRLVEAGSPAPLAGVYSGALVLLVPVAGRDALATVQQALSRPQQRSEIVVGVGDEYPNLFEARASCRQALAALDVGLRLRRPREPIHYRDVVVEVMLLGDRAGSERLVANYLAPLAGQPELEQTLTVYLEQGKSALAAAERLTVHVNTVGYRLRRVRELTGYDLRVPAVAVNVALALRARDLLAG